MKNLITFENFQDTEDSGKSKIWKIFAGLSGGFGGANFIKEFTGTKEEAEAEAYQEAKDIYDSYEGTSGLRTIEEIMEQDGLDEEEAEIEWEQEREDWLDYYVKELK